MFDWVLNTPLIKSIHMIFESVIKQFREKEGRVAFVGALCKIRTHFERTLF